METGIPIDAPLDRKFCHGEAGLPGAPDDFDVKHEALREDLAVDPSGAIAPVDLESALRVSEVPGYAHEGPDEELKQPTSQTSVGRLRVGNGRTSGSATAVGQIYPALAEFETSKRVLVWDTGSGIGEHHIFPESLPDSGTQGMTLAASGGAADHPGPGNAGRHGSGADRRVVGAAIVYHDDLTVPVKAADQKLTGILHVPLYLATFVEGGNHDGQLHVICALEVDMSGPALITGILGQDGAYLAQFLLQRGYDVIGLDHGGDRWRLEELGILEDLRLEPGDMRSDQDLVRAVIETRPEEIYNLASLSSVRESFLQPVATTQVTALGAMRMLEAFRVHAPEARFYQASSSEMFGKGARAPQDETTTFEPSSPYAAAKLHAHQMTRAYREAYGLFACCGILFNHESPLRGPGFVTRKISKTAASIAAGMQNEIRLGNVEAQRDFGSAPEYVEAMWLMLQQEKPGDYVVATGEAHSIQRFAEVAFEVLGLSLEDHLVSDAGLLRPTDPDLVCGNSAKAKRELGWTASTGFEDLVRIMVESDQARIDRP